VRGAASDQAADGVRPAGYGQRPPVEHRAVEAHSWPLHSHRDLTGQPARAHRAWTWPSRKVNGRWGLSNVKLYRSPIICLHRRHRSVGCLHTDIPIMSRWGPGPQACASARRALSLGRPGGRYRRRITGLPSGQPAGRHRSGALPRLSGVDSSRHIAGGDRSAGPPTAWIYATPNRRRRLIRLAGKDQPGQIEMTDGAVRPGHDPERFACVITIPAQPCAVPGRLEPGGRIVIGSGRGTVRYCRALRPQRPGAALGLRRYQPRPSGFGGFDCRALAAVDSDPGRESLKMRRVGGWVSPPGRSLA
jgi:hypothetical protein